ncbi:hypothetical protein [Bacillus sp. JCM 19041]|uniref:hypothetical protein n=1 Tax=Bacillus sp. JCM 19041 TaxID=1460637 RepID=UPI0006D26417
MNNNVQTGHYQGQDGYQTMGEDVKQQCHRYMNYHVIGEMNDGSQFEGIIDGMDEEGVTMLIPEDIMENNNRQQYGYDGGYDGYGRPRRRYRRYRRRHYPYRFLRNIFLYPFFYPYPGYGGY